MAKLGLDEDTPIDSGLLSNTIQNAQKNLEGRNFAIRKNVLMYDDVMNTQRSLIYKQRREVLDGEDVHDTIVGMIDSYVTDACGNFLNGETPEEWNLESLRAYFLGLLTRPEDFVYTTEELDKMTHGISKTSFLTARMPNMPKRKLSSRRRIYVRSNVSFFFAT